MELKDLVKALRKALEFTQEQLADRSVPEGGARPLLKREEIVKIERGELGSRADRVRRGLAAGFGLSREDTDAFIDGHMSVEEAHRRSKAGLASPILYGDVPGWKLAEEQARAVAPMGLEGYHFMAARMARMVYPPNTGTATASYVTAIAWVLSCHLSPGDLENARQMEMVERARFPRQPPKPSK